MFKFSKKTRQKKIGEDYPLFIQEISTAVISCGAFVLYAARNNEKASYWLGALGVMIIVAMIGKYQVLAGRFNLPYHKPQRGKKYLNQINKNLVVHECCTAIFAITVGTYLAPIFQSIFVLERFSYPSPRWFFFMLILATVLKVALYSKIMDVQQFYPLKINWYFEKIPGVIKATPWSIFLQAACTFVLGFVVGVYLYRSGTVFQYAQDNPEYYSEDVFEKKTALIGPFWGPEKIVKQEYHSMTFDEIWRDDVLGVYLKFCVFLFVVSMLAKVYAPANRLFFQGRLPDKYLVVPPGYQEGMAFREFSNLLLGFAVGLMIIPILRNAFWYRRAAYAPFAPGLLVFACSLKVLSAMASVQVSTYVLEKLKFSPLFSAGDFKDPVAIIIKLRDARDPVSRHLKKSFCAKMRNMLQAYKGGQPSSEILETLAEELNRLLRRGPIYNQQLFAKIKLRPETKKLIVQKPQGRQLIRLNRLLLEDAYPYKIVRARDPITETLMRFQ